jgi:hypothetical protein
MPTKNATPATPTLSEAVAVTVIVADTVAPLAGEVMETVGSVVSPPEVVLDTVTVTPAEVAVLPAASRARAVRTRVPFATWVVFHSIVYFPS